MAECSADVQATVLSARRLGCASRYTSFTQARVSELRALKSMFTNEQHVRLREGNIKQGSALIS